MLLLGQHAACAALEAPLLPAEDAEFFGTNLAYVAASLAANGELSAPARHSVVSIVISKVSLHGPLPAPMHCRPVLHGLLPAWSPRAHSHQRSHAHQWYPQTHARRMPCCSAPTLLPTLLPLRRHTARHGHRCVAQHRVCRQPCSRRHTCQHANVEAMPVACYFSSVQASWRGTRTT